MEEYLYAIDISMACTGLVIFDMKTLKPVVVTSITTKPKLEYGERLNQIAEGLRKYIKQYPCKEVAMERGFTQFNEATQVIFRVHGVINYLFYKYPQTYYAPTTIKSVVAGNGKATKERVKSVIISKYPDIQFIGSKDNDDSDAMAVAICHMVKKYKMPWLDKPTLPKPRTRKGKSD